MVDAAIRARSRGAPAAIECSSPRQSAVIIVTGIWSEALAESARAVVAQAPEGTRVLALGDCAQGRGALADALGGVASAAQMLGAEGSAPGCTASIDDVLEGVRRVSG
jgi:Ni,Fe-hydrogenase III small subunit